VDVDVDAVAARRGLACASRILARRSSDPRKEAPRAPRWLDARRDEGALDDVSWR
jgi:hypothetical protein